MEAAKAMLRRRRGPDHPDAGSPDGSMDALGLRGALLAGLGRTDEARAAFEDVIASGHPEYAARAPL